MATYAELSDVAKTSDGVLRSRVQFACIVAAHAVAAEADAVPNHANRLKWAKRVMEDPEVEAARMLWFALAENKSATLAQINGVTDAQIQTVVNGAVNLFAQV